ncbi:hypothetical protein BESB_043250 [Besnoitia besnoiti]|uniref:Uncharacterized protein n=1 Tax=Besnoitia besnoiti TaxID=94643 RepID=A0A2A9MKD1_BESBE|nr:hypothetical protein BESB_043250 [Besnoitia besnoiti]PFH36133.1 hypothetical protein BESB_043250 [Besnoitia besnoiti]
MDTCKPESEVGRPLTASSRPFCCSIPAFASPEFCGVAERQSRASRRMVHAFEVGNDRCLVTQFVRSAGYSCAAVPRCGTDSSRNPGGSRGHAGDSGTAALQESRSRGALLGCCDYLLRRLLPSVLSASLDNERTFDSSATAQRRKGNAQCCRCRQPLHAHERAEPPVYQMRIPESPPTHATREQGTARRSEPSTGASWIPTEAGKTSSAHRRGPSANDGSSRVVSSLSAGNYSDSRSAAIAYAFFADRLRAIRKEAVCERLSPADVFIILLQSSRFHLFAEYFWGGGRYCASALPPESEGSPPASGLTSEFENCPTVSAARPQPTQRGEEGSLASHGGAGHLPARVFPSDGGDSQPSTGESHRRGTALQGPSPKDTFVVSGFSPSLNRFLLSSCLAQLIGIILRESRYFFRRRALRKQKAGHAMSSEGHLSRDVDRHASSSDDSRAVLEEFARGLGVETSEIDEAISYFFVFQALAVPLHAPSNAGKERCIFAMQEILNALGKCWGFLPWSAWALRVAIQASSGVAPHRVLLAAKAAPIPFLLQCAMYPHADRLRAAVLAGIKMSAPSAAAGTVVPLQRVAKLMSCDREAASSVCLRLAVGDAVYSDEGRAGTQEVKRAELAAGESCTQQSAGGTCQTLSTQPANGTPYRISAEAEGLSRARDAVGNSPSGLRGEASSGTKDARYTADAPHALPTADNTATSRELAGFRVRRTDASRPAGAAFGPSSGKAAPSCFSELLVSVGDDAWTRSAPAFAVRAPADASELRNLFAWPPLPVS